MDDVLISMTVVDFKEEDEEEEEEIMGPNTKHVAWVTTGGESKGNGIWFLTCDLPPKVS